MNSILATGLSGMKHYLDRLKNTANNAANVNTAGFRAVTVSSSENSVSAGTQKTVGAGVRSVVRAANSRQGAPVKTGNPLDMAINGNGFFRLRTPEGDTVYTRNGAFSSSPGGEIVSSEGYILEPGIEIPENAGRISIDTGGVVTAAVPGEGRPVELGSLELARFNNSGGLKPLGGGKFAETAASGAPAAGAPGEGGFGSVMQGFLESSNVDIIDTQVELITTHRSFQANAQTVKTADEMLGTIVNIKK